MGADVLPARKALPEISAVPFFRPRVMMVRGGPNIPSSQEQKRKKTTEKSETDAATKTVRTRAIQAPSGGGIQFESIVTLTSVCILPYSLPYGIVSVKIGGYPRGSDFHL